MRYFSDIVVFESVVIVIISKVFVVVLFVIADQTYSFVDIKCISVAL